MMTDLLAGYQRDLNADLKKLTTDLAQALVAAAKTVEEFNAATAARGVAFEAEMAERMRHFREGPRDGVVAVESMAGRIAPAGPTEVSFRDPPEALMESPSMLHPPPFMPAMPNVYESTGAP